MGKGLVSHFKDNQSSDSKSNHRDSVVNRINHNKTITNLLYSTR